MRRSNWLLIAIITAAWLIPSVAGAQSVSETRTLQQALSLLGYDVGTVDGRMGPRTMSALIRYQRERGLLSTGRLDTPTCDRLVQDLQADEPRAPTRSFEYDPSPETSPGITNSGPPAVFGLQGEYLGNLSRNEYDLNSTSNPYGQYGSPYAPQSINNPYSTYGSPYSPDGVRNPYTSGGPGIYARDGTYLGRMNANRYDPESISNPYGRYGSRYSPNSINNPYGTYGSPYSTMSPNNPYLSGWDDD